MISWRHRLSIHRLIPGHSGLLHETAIAQGKPQSYTLSAHVLPFFKSLLLYTNLDCHLIIFVFSSAFLFSIQAANSSDFLWWQPRSKCEQQKLCFAPGQICGSWHAKCQASGNSQRTKPIMLFAASKANSSWLLVGTSLVQEHVACTALRKVCQATPWKQSKGSGCTVVVATHPRVSCLPEREWHKLVDMRQEYVVETSLARYVVCQKIADSSRRLENGLLHWSFPRSFVRGPFVADFGYPMKIRREKDTLNVTRVTKSSSDPSDPWSPDLPNGQGAAPLLLQNGPSESPVVEAYTAILGSAQYFRFLPVPSHYLFEESRD